MKELHLEVITPQKAAYEGEVKSLTVPGSLGAFQILYNHAPILSSLKIGKVKIVELDNSEHEFAIGGGTVEVSNNNILLLAESFESADDIDVERAKQALERAKERLSIKSKEEVDTLRAEAALNRAMNRLKLTGNYSVKSQ